MPRGRPVGVDEVTGLVQSVVTTAANVGDLLHGNESVVSLGAKRSRVKPIEDDTLRALTDPIEHIKASIRAAVEPPFRVIKRQFDHVEARYRGLAQKLCAGAAAVCVEQRVDNPTATTGAGSYMSRQERRQRAPRQRAP